MLAAGLASSMAQSNVYSLNVVGYVNTALTAGGRYNSVANPLNTANNVFSNVLAGVPNNSQVLKWNHAIVDFTVINKTPFGTWSPAGSETTTLNPGEGVLVRAGSPATNTFVGEVLQGTLTTVFPAGYEMRASQVPEANTVTALGLTATIPGNSQLLKWDSSLGTIGDWVVFNRTPFNTWSPSEPSLGVGEPFLLKAASAFNWVRNFTVQ